MSQKLLRFKAEEISRILRKNGFIFISQNGSHQKWRNDGTRRQVIVPFHKARQLPSGTIKSIIIGSGIPEEEFQS